MRFPHLAQGFVKTYLRGGAHPLLHEPAAHRQSLAREREIQKFRNHETVPRGIAAPSHVFVADALHDVCGLLDENDAAGGRLTPARTRFVK